MEKVYKYKLGRRVPYTSVLYILLFVALGVLLAFIYEGGYISAWFIMLIAAVFALMVLSIPRDVVLTEQHVEIRCLSERTVLHYTDIAHVACVSRKRLSTCLPLVASCGFFGFYGIYFDLRNMERVWLYCSQWDNFVEITTRQGRRYYVATNEATHLAALLAQHITPHDITENI